MKRIDNYTSKLIAIGKEHSYLRIPMFLTVLLLIAVSGIAKLCLDCIDTLRSIVKIKIFTRAIAFTTAFFIVMPFFSPAAELFALDETTPDVSITEPVVPNESGETPVVPDESGETPVVPDESGETPVVPDESGETPVVPDESGETPVVPDESGETPVVPDESGDAPVVPDESGDAPVVPDESGDAPVVPDDSGAVLPPLDITPGLMLLGNILGVEDPMISVKIETSAELAAFLSNADIYTANDIAYLDNDIDMTGVSFTPKNFAGTFNGYGYTISNISYSAPNGKTGAAMFQKTTGTIINVGVVNASFVDTNSFSHAAIFSASGGGNVTNCYVLNSTVTSSNGYVGRFFVIDPDGANTPSTLTNCYFNNCTLSGYIMGAGTEFYKSTSLSTLNSDISGDMIPWYKDTCPTERNYGFPSLKPSYKVQYVNVDPTSDSSGDVIYTDEITFGGKNASDCYSVGGQTISAPDILPTRTGYRFLGWSTSRHNPNSIWSYSTELSQSDHTTLDDGSDGWVFYAQWELVPTYTVSIYEYNFETSSYEVLDSVTDPVNTGEPIPADKVPSTPTRTGYTFDGWYLGNEDTSAVGGVAFVREWNFEDNDFLSKEEFLQIIPSPSDITVEIKLYQKWTLNEYNITLETAGGTLQSPFSSPITYTIEDNNEEGTAEISLPTQAEVIKTGYTFSNWKITESDNPLYPVGTESVLSIPISALSDIELTAQWTANTYTVTYSGNGNSNSEVTMSDSTFTYDNPATEELRPNEYTKDYYTFAGWAIGDSDNVSYSNRQSVHNLIPSGTLSLRAIWTPTPYTVTYVDEANRIGDITNPNPTSFNITSEDITLEDASRPGYTFEGWYSDPELNNEITTIPANTGRDITIYSKWALIKYSVSYSFDDGTLGIYKPTFIYDIESADILLPTDDQISKQYYHVSKWSVISTPYGRTGNYTADDTDKIPAGSYGDITVVVEWAPVEYSVSFVIPNDASFSEVPSDKYTYESDYTLPVPERTGYNFVGWKVSYADGESGNLAGDSVILRIENNYGNIILTAEWEAKSITVTFDSNRGTDIGTDSAPITQDYGTDVTAPSALPTRYGYHFVEWCTEPECENAYTFSTMPAEDFTLYAKWEINVYEVTFDTSGGTVIPMQNITHGLTATDPDVIPLKAAVGTTGYYFTGWFTDNTYQIPFDFSKPITNNTIVYAKMQSYSLSEPPTSYTLSYKENPDSTDDEIVIIGTYFENELVTLPAMTDDIPGLRTFLGWKSEGLDPDRTYASEAIISMPSNNVLLIGKWDVVRYDVTFDSDGGTAVQTQSVAHNNTALNVSPTKTGYIFEGWFLNNTEYDFSTPVTAPITLVAHWREAPIVIPPSPPITPGGGGTSSNITYEKTIRVVEAPEGIPSPGKIKVKTNISDFRTSIDIRITNINDIENNELYNKMKEKYPTSKENIFLFDISLYIRGTSKLANFPDGASIRYDIPIPEEFEKNADKIKVVTLNKGKLELLSSKIVEDDLTLLSRFASTHSSPYAFVLDMDNTIQPEDFAATSGITMSEIYVPDNARNIQTDGVSSLITKRGSIISRKKKRYRILSKTH